MIECPICSGDMRSRGPNTPVVLPRFRHPSDPAIDRFCCRVCDIEFRRYTPKGTMEVECLPLHRRQERMNIRNFLMTATLEQLKQERTIRPTPFRVACINELILELE